ncbi:MAG TPA: DUF5615 family PIN-like protein [Cyclobacteriaceae bacterium]
MHKFIIDENISPVIADIFRSSGLEAYHVNEMKTKKNQRIRDDQLRKYSLHKDYIIVTKDDDFVKSYIARKVPDKLIYIYGLDNKSDLIKRIKSCVKMIPSLITKDDFLEINRNEIKIPFK